MRLKRIFKAMGLDVRIKDESQRRIERRREEQREGGESIWEGQD